MREHVFTRRNGGAGGGGEERERRNRPALRSDLSKKSVSSVLLSVNGLANWNRDEPPSHED